MVLFLATTLTLVYASNLVSAVVLELRLARRIDADEMRGRSFYVLPSVSLHRGFIERLSHSPATALVAFRLVGAHARAYLDPVGESFDGFPWSDLDLPNLWVPFRVSVRWAVVEGPLAGGGVRTTCICVFGFVLREDDRLLWSA